MATISVLTCHNQEMWCTLPILLLRRLVGKIYQLCIYKDSNWQLMGKVLQSFCIYHV